MTRWRVLLLFALLFAGRPQGALAEAVRINPGFLTNSIPRNDDGSTSAAVPIGFTVNFFGVTFDSAFVNNNGNITFGGPLSTFTPEGLVASPLRIIAPFWADVDTRAEGSSLVTYGQDTVDGRRAFGVNWVKVGYYGSHDDKLNSFQLVLIDRSDIKPGDFDIEFNYDQILWETGDASGGSGGLGGVSASAGYSNGSGTAESSFEILGSRRNGIFLDSNRNGLRYRRLNSTVRGRLVFFVRDGAVGCTYAALSVDETFPWEGGTGSVQVAAPGDCEWTAVSNASFITITSESVNHGSQIIEYSVAVNRSSSPRTGTLTVAGQTITVTQEAFITIHVTPSTISLSSVEGAVPSRVALRIESIRGTIDWFASVAPLNGRGWRLALNPPSGSATANTEPSFVTLELNPDLLLPLPGVVYQTTITVRDVTNGPVVEVPVVLQASPPGGRLLLSQSSFVFRASQGGPAPPPQTLRLVNSGPGSLSWSIPSSALIGSSWLSLSLLAGAAVSASTTSSATVLSVNPAGLAPGVYQVLLHVSTPEAPTDPKLVTVTLHVAPAATAAAGDISPNGLVFVASQGRAAPAAQSLTVSNQGAGDLPFRLTPSTASGGNWLGLSTTSGNAGSATVTVPVTANPAGLSPGIYRGRIAVAFSTGAEQEVNVLLVVGPPGGNPVLGGGSNCAPRGMDLVATTVGSGASLAASFPRPLLALLVDTCGSGVNDATVIADVEGTAVVLQRLGKGLYSGMWTPVFEALAAPVRFTALHPSFAGVQRTFTVSTLAAPGEVILPVLATDGVVDGAGFMPRAPLAPGGILSLFGAQLATGESFASRVPLERQLAGVRVQIGSEDAPLYYVGPSQINAQAPFTASPGETLSVVAQVGGLLTAPQSLLMAPVQPNVFHSGGIVAALDGRSRPITLENPARVGDTIQIFATGLGLVDPAVGTGAAAPNSSTVRDRVTATIGGVEVPVVYQGLAPGFVGLYQANVVLPSSITPGDLVPVILRQNGVSSNPSGTVTIPVRRP